VKAPTPFKRRMRDHPITKLFHPWQRWKRCVVLFMMVRGVLKMEVRLGFNESFFFSSHFSLSYPKNSRYPFQKSIKPFSLYFYQIWHLFFLLPFVLLFILLKVFVFLNFILRHFNSYNLFIQFDPYYFDCFFFVCFILDLFVFQFHPSSFYFIYLFWSLLFWLLFSYIFLYFIFIFSLYILFYFIFYPILVLILFILFFLNFFFQFGP
jgi:hypothetical protein